MPSVILGNASGGQQILSGFGPLWSGKLGNPTIGGCQLRLDITGGRAYVALSGGVTITSGGLTSNIPNTSGIFDGLPMSSGDAMFIPKLGIGPSGLPQIFVATDAASSGVGRMYFEIY
jgi:hypothetical protein